MSDILKLRLPVRTPDGHELLPAMEAPADEMLAAVTARRPAGADRLYALLDHGQIARDLHAFMAEGPYATIFAEVDTSAAVTSLMREAVYPTLVLDCLDWFREVDFTTYRHILLVFALSTRLAWALTGDHRRIALEVMAGPTHDLGKVCVPPEILRKGTALTPNERELLEQHTWAGWLLLAHYLGEPEHHAARVARDHHEKRDGSGYPRGIRQDDQLVEIVAAADVYDALISPRPYRSDSFDNRTALEEMTAMAQFGQFGDEVVRALVACNRSDKPDHHRCVVSRERRGTAPADSVYGRYAPETESTKEDEPAVSRPGNV